MKTPAAQEPVPAPSKFKHPGLSKLGLAPVCMWPKKEREAKYRPRYWHGASSSGRA